MITPRQIRGARAMLGLSQADLATRAGISPTAFNAIKQGTADPKASTLSLVEAALESKGAVFTADGVRIVAPSERFLVADPENPPDSVSRARALAILNAGRAARGLPPIKDDGNGK